jgi:hypothetical protein
MRLRIVETSFENGRGALNVLKYQWLPTFNHISLQINSSFLPSSAPNPKSSGMGLAISPTIVESQGGRLWATANDGRGAAFHFTLPLQVTESSPLVD